MKTETIEGFVPARRPYQPPRLVTYGKLQDLTRGNASGNSDASGKSMVCWVAEALYGVNDPRTHLLRAWLNGPYESTKTGSMVVGLYRTIGREVAAVARHAALVRTMLRPLFDAGLRRAQRHYMVQ